MKLLVVFQLVLPIWAAAIADLDPHSNPPIYIDSKTDAVGSPAIGPRGYTSNYAGSGYTVSTSDPHFTYIKGTFNIPTVSVPSGGKGTYGGAAWPGIQGKGGIAQAGAIWTVSDTSKATYNVWVEYYPTGLQVLPELAVKPGDSLTVFILLASNQTQAKVHFENHTTGKQLVHYINSPNPKTPLQANSANWVVEDYSTGGGLFPFAKFTKVTFTDSLVRQGTKESYPGQGYPLSIVQNNKELATGNVPGGTNSQETTIVYNS